MGKGIEIDLNSRNTKVIFGIIITITLIIVTGWTITAIIYTIITTHYIYKKYLKDKGIKIPIPQKITKEAKKWLPK